MALARRRFRLMLVRATALMAVAAAAAGCGSPAAEVTGTVTYAGKPVSGGSVVLYCADGQIVRGLIGADGRYAIPNVPRGPAQVAVQTHARVPAGLSLRQKLPPAADGPVPPTLNGAAADRVVPVPPRYGVPEESGLGLTVDRPQMTFDIDLQP